MSLLALGWILLIVAAGSLGNVLGRLKSGRSLRVGMFLVALVSAGGALVCFALTDWGRA